MEYWEILLIKQCERGKDGLTIPFLIGSQKYLPSDTHQDIAGLIKAMSTGNSFEVCIRPCIGTQTLIAEIRKQKNKVYYPKTNTGKLTNISIGILLKNDLGEGIEQVIENLINKFQKVITDELFSAESDVYGRSAEWHKFSSNDITFIKDSFATLL